MVELRVLGSPDLRRSDGETITAILSQPKRAALLVYLTLAGRNGPVRRDALVALFWPEQDAGHARGALRQALSVLRRAVGEEAFVARGAEEVGIDARCIWCDVAAFEQALDAGESERALELYRSDLLPGFFVSEAPEFERWLEGERLRLRRRAAQAAWSLAEQAGASGIASGVGRWANRAIELAPDDEALLQQAVVLLDRVGVRAGALRAYDGFAERLHRDYEADPAPEAKRLIEAVRERLEAHGDRVLQLASPILGREPTTIAAGAHGFRGRLMTLVVGGALLLAWGPMADHGPPAAPYGAAGADPRIIAVLPFEPLPPDSATTFFAEGLTEDLVTRLSQISSLRVLSRSAVTRNSGRGGKQPDVGKKLGASFLVEGGVRQAANRIRITVRLLDVGQEQYLWSGQYDEELQDVLTAQTRAALSIAEGLEVRLSIQERADIQARPQSSLAWSYAEQARLLSNRAGANPELLPAAELLVKKAIAADSQYSTAWAVLAGVFWRQFLRADGGFRDSAEAAVARAIRLNPRDFIAYRTRSQLRFVTDFVAAFGDNVTALELNPSYAYAAWYMVRDYQNRGMFDRAALWNEYYNNLNPDEAPREFRRGDLDWKLGKYDTAEERLRRCIILDPGDLGARLRLAEVLVALQRYEDARAEIEIALAVSPTDDDAGFLAVAALIETLRRDYRAAQDHLIQLLRREPPFLESDVSGLMTKTLLGFVYLQAGDTVRANQMLNESLEHDLVALRDSANFWVAFHRYQDIARIHAIRGDRDEAMRWLERGYDKHRWQYVYTHLGPQDPTLENLRGDTRFERLVARARARIDDQRVRVEAMRLPLTRADFERMMAQARRDAEEWRGKLWWEWR